MLGYGLVAEEVLTVQTAAQLLQETKDVVYAVHHGKAEEVLLPVKRGWRREAPRRVNSRRRDGALFASSLVRWVKVKSRRTTPERRRCTTPDIFSPP